MHSKINMLIIILYSVYNQNCTWLYDLFGRFNISRHYSDIIAVLDGAPIDIRTELNLI